MFMDPELYSRSHGMQVKGANKLLDCVLPEMSFGEDDVIMDVGCRTGDNTKDVLLSRIPKLKKLIAIDTSPAMIEFAQRNAASPKIEYCLADIQDKISLSQWVETIAKCFSIYCFHWVKDQKKAFEVLYSLLRPKGEAAMIFVLSIPWWDCYPSLINDVKWNKYLKDADTGVPASHHLNLRSEYFRKMLKDIGFEILRCQEGQRNFLFPSDAEYRDTFRLLSALPRYIPEEHREEFMDDLLRGVFKLVPRNSEGVPVFSEEILTVHIRKS